jgi:hypothetical protein
MNGQAKPALVPLTRQAYKPVLSAIERRAYDAAHRIYGGDFPSAFLCPGRRRSDVIDQIAGIIINAMKGQKFTSPDYVALLPMKEGAIDAKAVDELVLGEARKMLELVGEFGIDVAGIGTRTPEEQGGLLTDEQRKATSETDD